MAITSRLRNGSLEGDVSFLARGGGVSNPVSFADGSLGAQPREECAMSSSARHELELGLQGTRAGAPCSCGRAGTPNGGRVGVALSLARTFVRTSAQIGVAVELRR